MLKVLTPQVCFQEVPNEVALGFLCTGCQIGCRGCHSPQTWNAKYGVPLSRPKFADWLRRYDGLITCVVFFGGEWQETLLIELLRFAKEKGLKTCLYTGLLDVSAQLKAQLTYLKTGPYIQALGGLEQPNSNQRFIDVASGQLLNSYFYRR
ncbi:anaerobic ribonucleoside-triphosphate reductase activating protein [Pseudoalteromonas sp. T1lg23B]|uniref:anaerobic ribonucleoside-triphosphate reductase activating protein n=1 Tax=Pseudoalteromonas sp. T1lg23B TaxID=2077097 RepID=UPI000CF74B56|nr:anaerobic ribonucleoside-triphosphate reductase activating protein [Pseudoalteromonas sp. T1lg23B]